MWHPASSVLCKENVLKVTLPTLCVVGVNTVFRESTQHVRERETSFSQACTSSLTGDMKIHYCFLLEKNLLVKNDDLNLCLGGYVEGQKGVASFAIVDIRM